MALDQSPYKFLDSYSAEDQSIFFGRDREVEEVYDKVFQGKLLLIYGASGSGKSSIINCGLANKFDESDWFPIHIRRGGNIRQSLITQIEKEAINKVSLTDEEKSTDKGLEKVINSVYLDHFKPIYLIFDQFEELFIFGFKDEWKEFISTIRFVMDTDLDIHFIFVIRGEYLEFLSEFEELIPEFFDNRMRVEKMTRKKAKEIIQGPAQAFNISIDTGFEEKLIKKLSPEKSQIELTFLQVFLDKIYKNATLEAQNSESVQFTNDQIEDLGQLGDVLAEFVDEQLFQMDDPKAALMVLKSFVSLQGTKVQNTVDEVVNYCADLGYNFTGEKVEGIIRSFVNKRILKDHDDNHKYELRHDSLAQKIFEKITNQERELLDVKQFLNYSYNEYEKRGTLLTDDDLSYISFYERNLEINQELNEFIEKSKKHSTKRLRSRRVKTVIISIILLLLVTSILGLFNAQRQRERAETLATVAQEEKERAENQKSVADQQRALAIQNEAKAANQAAIARQQTDLANQAKNEAEKQSLIALEQKTIAEKEKKEANKARESAEISEKEAVSQKDRAEEQRRIALRLRTLSLSKELAIKSTYTADKDLKALLSLHALRFIQENQGNLHDPDLYQSLYRARKAYFGSENLLTPHSSVLKDIAVRAGVTYTVGNDGRLIKYENGTPQTLLETKYAFEALLFLDDERLAIGSQNGTLLIFDLSTEEIINEQQIHSNDITGMLLHNGSLVSSNLDGDLIYSSPKDFKIEKRIDTGERINDMVLGDDEIWMLTGRNTLSLVSQNEIRKYNPVSGASLTSIDIDEEDQKIVLGSQKGDIWVWDIANQQIEQNLSGHSSAISDIEISDEFQFMASSSLDRTVRIWPLRGGSNQPIILNDLDNWASAVCFREDQVLTGSYSGSLMHFELLAVNLSEGLCEKIGRELTAAEWEEYLAEGIKMKSACD